MMKKNLAAAFLSALLSMTAVWGGGFNRAPLSDKDYARLPLGSIKAEGWILDQLQRMSAGMTGHLDELYPQVMGSRNGWLGGDGDVWERGPYWIDGLLPLAYILDDPALKAKVQPWIEWTLASQQEDGYLGPSTDRSYEFGLQRDNSHDWWPKMVMLKILAQYYDATADRRIPPFLSKYFRYQLEHLPEQPLGHWTYWGMMRGGDNLQVVLWLYNITGEEFLLELADLIHHQTFDWTGKFKGGEFVRTPGTVHCVNLAQGFKEPAVYYQKSGDKSALECLKKAERDIRSSTGLPTGLWVGDEILGFGDPTKGSELCTAVEMMFSLESILEITGDAHWADYLEKVAFNALPTQVTDDYGARQYYQQCNQIEVSYKERNFNTCYDGTDQLFGILAGYPCCTSNMHQGWPKFVQNLWYKTSDGGVAALVYGPSSVTLELDGKKVSIKENTIYPADESICFEVSIAKGRKASFPFHFRIPGWSKESKAYLNGEEVAVTANEDGIAVLNRTWKNGDKLSLSFGAEVTVSRWYERSAVLERGPLVYALKMNEIWERKTIDPKYKGYYGKEYLQVTSDSPWNYCLLEKEILDPANSFIVSKKETNGYFWDLENAPITITAHGRRLPSWHEYNGSAGPMPYSLQYRAYTMPTEEITLIPYGCTTLRITEFPVTNAK